MATILVTYATMAGSTGEVAQVIGEEISKSGLQVEVLPIQKVSELKGYAGVVVGAPMIMGWHRAALGFLRHHRADLQHTPLAVFVMAMSLTQTGETSIEGVPVFVDEKFAKPPQQAAKLSFKERYARLSNYLRPIFSAARPAKPVSIAVFGGRMEYGRLKWWAVLFAMLIIQATAGDRRDWKAIRSWARNIPTSFGLG
jgi:menaquinone-dependent protoporphyrinogen IX oxidase